MMQRPRIVSKIVLAACTLHNLLAEKNPSRMQLATDSEEQHMKFNQENGDIKTMITPFMDFNGNWETQVHNLENM